MMWEQRPVLEILEDACSALSAGRADECHRLIHEARMAYAQEQQTATVALMASQEQR